MAMRSGLINGKKGFESCSIVHQKIPPFNEEFFNLKTKDYERAAVGVQVLQSNPSQTFE